MNQAITLEQIQRGADAAISELNYKPGVYCAADLLKRKIENIPTLLEPIFPKVGLVGLAGSSDTGKSSLLRQFAVSVCTGENEFLGFELRPVHNRAIYVSTEDDDFAVSFLLNRLNTEKRLEPEQYSGLQFVFDTGDLISKLQSMIEDNPTDLIIIDAFSDLYGRSMNDTNQVRTFLNEYSQLAQKHKCLIIFLHHTGKRTEDLPPSKHNLLGSQGFEAKMRLVIELRTDPNEHHKRHLCIVKGNYLPKEYKTESFVLEFNENLMFSNTNERILFDELRPENKTELKNTVKKLEIDGLTQMEISKKLKISQATVSRYLRE